MRREGHMTTLRTVAALAVLAAAVPGDGLACGDKFLVPSRGTRFRSRVDRASARVVLYARPGSPLEETLRARSVEAGLRAAGYRPARVTSPDALESAFRGGGWDVVVVELGDATDVVGGLPAATAPLVLPVAYEASRAALDEAKRLYRRVLREPTRYQAFLHAIDDLVAARGKARARSVSGTRDR